MIVQRFNFETNSSSMHSLSVRRAEGEYTPEEMKLCESIYDDMCVDVIMTTNVGDEVFTTEEILNDCYMFGKELNVSSYEVDYIQSPMQVLRDFRAKVMYLIASAISSDDTDYWMGEIAAVFTSILPEYKINLDKFGRMNVYSRGRKLAGGVTEEIVFKYLKLRGISLRDFLLRKKYIVIVNYAEYCKMKNLNMVDESTIIDMYPQIEIENHPIDIVDGVWKLTSLDITFGRTPFRVLGTPEGKARYALASYRSKNIDEVLAIMQEVYPELESIELPLDPWEKSGVETGYAEDSAIPTDIPLREFILNKKYVIISDGDEYCIWKEFKKTPMFNQKEYFMETDDDD